MKYEFKVTFYYIKKNLYLKIFQNLITTCNIKYNSKSKQCIFPNTCNRDFIPLYLFVFINGQLITNVNGRQVHPL